MKRQREFDDCAEQLKAVADAERLRIVSLLLGGEHNVSELSAKLRDDIVNVSHHLGILRRAGIVQATKRGRFVIYTLHPDVFIAPTGPNDSPQIQFGCCRLDLEP